MSFVPAARYLTQLGIPWGARGSRYDWKILKLWMERGSDLNAARKLMLLAYANHWLTLRKEGAPQAKEASEIFERLNDTSASLCCSPEKISPTPQRKPRPAQTNSPWTKTGNIRFANTMPFATYTTPEVKHRWRLVTPTQPLGLPLPPAC